MGPLKGKDAHSMAGLILDGSSTASRLKLMLTRASAVVSSHRVSMLERLSNRVLLSIHTRAGISSSGDACDDTMSLYTTIMQYSTIHYSTQHTVQSYVNTAWTPVTRSCVK